MHKLVITYSDGATKTIYRDTKRECEQYLDTLQRAHTVGEFVMLPEIKKVEDE